MGRTLAGEKSLCGGRYGEIDGHWSENNKVTATFATTITIHHCLFEILVEQGIQRSSDHSRRRGPVFGENEVSQIFWEWDKVSKQTLDSNYRSIKLNIKNCYKVRLMRWWGGRTHISFQSWSPNQPRLSRWMGWRTDEWGRIRTGGNPI